MYAEKMYAEKTALIFVALFSSLASLTAAPLAAQDLGYPGNPGDPPSTVARITYLSGNVSLQAYGSDEWSDAPPNYPMVGGDRVYTAYSSRALLQLGGAELRIGQATDVTLTNLTDQYEQLALAQGSVHLRVFELDPGSQIEVDTPNGAVLVESPGDYRIDADSRAGISDVIVASGNAQLTGPGLNQPLTSGYAMEMLGANPIEIQYIDLPQYDSLDSWSYQLDQRLQNSQSARYVNRQMVGYSDLDANGTWQPESEYGPVWYPNAMPEGWRPYSVGHWAYVVPWGYTWVDDAPWGFAPFHYGRWAVVQGRWGWIPGPPRVRPVYSPALVAFVGGGPGSGGGISVGFSFGGGGGGVAAWFPIGVGEPYVPWYRCSPSYARQVNTSNVNLAVIHNTTIINNYNTYITNIHVTNTTVIHNTNVTNTNVTENHFNYANRASVTAVPVAAMSSGASVARQQVRLTPQQQTQLVQAPIAARPTAPPPATPHPSLIAAKANIPLPATRPTVMTPTGQARAVPSAAHAAPVAINRLPEPKVVPKNAAPPPVQRAAPAPGIRPAPPSVSPVHAAPAVAAKPGMPMTSAPAQRPPPAPAVAPAPVQRPGTTPVAPATRSVEAAPTRAMPAGTKPAPEITKPAPLSAKPAPESAKLIPERQTTPVVPVTRPTVPQPLAPQRSTSSPVQKTTPPPIPNSEPRTDPNSGKKPEPASPGRPEPRAVSPPTGTVNPAPASGRPTPDTRKPEPAKTPADKNKPEPKKEQKDQKEPQ